MTQNRLHDIAPCQLVVLRHGRQAEWNSHERPLVTFDQGLFYRRHDDPADDATKGYARGMNAFFRD